MSLFASIGFVFLSTLSAQASEYCLVIERFLPQGPKEFELYCEDEKPVVRKIKGFFGQEEKKKQLEAEITAELEQRGLRKIDRFRPKATLFLHPRLDSRATDQICLVTRFTNKQKKTSYLIDCGDESLIEFPFTDEARFDAYKAEHGLEALFDGEIEVTGSVGARATQLMKSRYWSGPASVFKKPRISYLLDKK